MKGEQYCPFHEQDRWLALAAGVVVCSIVNLLSALDVQALACLYCLPGRDASKESWLYQGPETKRQAIEQM